MMKNIVLKISLILIILLGIYLKSDAQKTACPKMLGAYNTFTVSALPNMSGTQNNYYYYDYYGYNQAMKSGFSIRNTAGYRFFDCLNIGMGAGIEMFDRSALNVPIYGELSGNILNRKFTPVYYLQGGYGAAINASQKDNPNRWQKVSGGAMMAAGIGFAVKLDAKTMVRLNVGYHFQKARYEKEIEPYQQVPYLYVQNMTYHRIELGLSFTYQ